MSTAQLVNEAHQPRRKPWFSAAGEEFVATFAGIGAGSLAAFAAACQNLLAAGVWAGVAVLVQIWHRLR